MTKLRDILHVLRNPSGYSDETIRQARLDAAEIIETTKRVLDRRGRPNDDLWEIYELY